MEIWQIIPAIYALIGVGVFIFVARKPKFFRLFLVCIAVGIAGLIMIPKQPYSVALVDEVLTAAAVGGALLAFKRGEIKIVKKSRSRLEQIHLILFYVLAGYLLLQSIRGLFLWQNVLLLRWVCFYVLIIAVAFLTSSTDLPAPKKPALIRAVLWSWLVYLAAYLAHGFFIQLIYGISDLSLTVQGVQWTGPNYALFPAVVAIPAAMLYLRQGFGIKQWLGWAVIIITLFAGYCYESRAVFAGMAAFTLLSPTVLALRKVVPIALIGAGAVVLFYWNVLFGWILAMLQTVTFSYSGDSGRWAIIRASINAICQRADTFLFGYGINSHHYVLPPFMLEAGHPTIEETPDYSASILPGDSFVYNQTGGLPDYVRVTGFGSLLTDIGIVGAILFAAVFFVLALRLLRAKKAIGRYLIITSLVLAMSWFLFSKIEDIVLVWFMLMPSGILLTLLGDENNDSPPVAVGSKTP